MEARISRLAFGQADRSPSVQRSVGREGGAGSEGSEGSHLAANWWGGGPERINVVPLLEQINRGAGHSYGNLERRWAQLLRGTADTPPVTVEDVRIEVLYEDNTRVPRKVPVRWPMFEHFRNGRGIDDSGS